MKTDWTEDCPLPPAAYTSAHSNHERESLVADLYDFRLAYGDLTSVATGMSPNDALILRNRPPAGFDRSTLSTHEPFLRHAFSVQFNRPRARRQPDESYLADSPRMGRHGGRGYRASGSRYNPCQPDPILREPAGLGT